MRDRRRVPCVVRECHHLSPCNPVRALPAPPQPARAPLPATRAAALFTAIPTASPHSPRPRRPRPDGRGPPCMVRSRPSHRARGHSSPHGHAAARGDGGEAATRIEIARFTHIPQYSHAPRALYTRYPTLLIIARMVFASSSSSSSSSPPSSLISSSSPLSSSSLSC